MSVFKSDNPDFFLDVFDFYNTKLLPAMLGAFTNITRTINNELGVKTEREELLNWLVRIKDPVFFPTLPSFSLDKNNITASLQENYFFIISNVVFAVNPNLDAKVKFFKNIINFDEFVKKIDLPRKDPAFIDALKALSLFSLDQFVERKSMSLFNKEYQVLTALEPTVLSALEPKIAQQTITLSENASVVKTFDSMRLDFNKKSVFLSICTSLAIENNLPYQNDMLENSFAMLFGYDKLTNNPYDLSLKFLVDSIKLKSDKNKISENFQDYFLSLPKSKLQEKCEKIVSYKGLNPFFSFDPDSKHEVVEALPEKYLDLILRNKHLWNNDSIQSVVLKPFKNLLDKPKMLEKMKEVPRNCTLETLLVINAFNSFKDYLDLKNAVTPKENTFGEKLMLSSEDLVLWSKTKKLFALPETDSNKFIFNHWISENCFNEETKYVFCPDSWLKDFLFTQEIEKNTPNLTSFCKAVFNEEAENITNIQRGVSLSDFEANQQENKIIQFFNKYEKFVEQKNLFDAFVFNFSTNQNNDVTPLRTFLSEKLGETFSAWVSEMHTQQSAFFKQNTISNFTFSVGDFSSSKMDLLFKSDNTPLEVMQKIVIDFHIKNNSISEKNDSTEYITNSNFKL